MSIQEDISLRINTSKIGSTLKVLIDRVEGDYLIARTEFDSPEVDNEVLILKSPSAPVPGSFANVVITGAESYDLYAEIK